MQLEDLKNLKPGDLLYCRTDNQTVDVKFGPWSNPEAANGGIYGQGLYVEYDDGYRSEVGFEYLDEDALAELEFVPAEQHNSYY